MELEKLMNMTKNFTVLFVEDDKRSAKSSISFFEEFFDKIIYAQNGLEGFEKFKENSIDLIITDLNMPKLNGLEMIKKIRKINRSVPIIILTAYNESVFFMESIKLGVEAYLLKPINFDKFTDALKKVSECLYNKKENRKYIKILKDYYEFTAELKKRAKENPESLANFILNSFND